MTKVHQMGANYLITLVAIINRLAFSFSIQIKLADSVHLHALEKKFFEQIMTDQHHSSCS